MDVGVFDMGQISSSDFWDGMCVSLHSAPLKSRQIWEENDQFPSQFEDSENCTHLFYIKNQQTLLGAVQFVGSNRSISIVLTNYCYRPIEGNRPEATIR
jgi:hypothetical protein